MTPGRVTRLRSLSEPEVFADLLDDGTGTRVSFHVPAGHRSPSVQADLVDAVLDSVCGPGQRPVRITLPLGDTEILAQLRRRCERVSVRAAGATCLVDTVGRRVGA